MKFDSEERQRRIQAALADHLAGYSLAGAARRNSVPRCIRVTPDDIRDEAAKHHIKVKPKTVSQHHVDQVQFRDIQDACMLLERGKHPHEVAKRYGIEVRELGQWRNRHTSVLLAREGIPTNEIARRLGVNKKHVRLWLDVVSAPRRRQRRLEVDPDYGRKVGNTKHAGRLWAYMHAGYTDEEIHNRDDYITGNHFKVVNIRRARFTYEVVHAVWAGAQWPELKKIAQKHYPVPRELHIHRLNTLLNYYGMRDNLPSSFPRGRDCGPQFGDNLTSIWEMAKRCLVHHVYIEKAVRDGRIPQVVVERHGRTFHRIPRDLPWPLPDGPILLPEGEGPDAQRD